MTTLLLIRHGQSVANLENVFAGHLDKPLTELGVKQARLTAEYIKENFSVDAVYASDLSRAFATGKAVADAFGLKAVPDKELREIYGGKWEGANYLTLPEEYPEEFGIWLSDIGHARCPEGESTAEVQRRMVAALRRIARDNEGRTVAVATHACVIRCVMSYCKDKSTENMKDVPWVSNASVTVLKAEKGEFFIKEAGIDRHLGALSSAFGKGV